MDKKLTLLTSSGDNHTLLSVEQISKLSLPFPFVGSREEYDLFLGTLTVLNPDNKMKHRYAGLPQDNPFGSLICWIEYTEEY